MTIILRPGQRILNIPGIGVRMSRRAVGAGGAGGNGLLNALIAYWPGNEASGDLQDAHTNALHLTDNNTVTNAAGKVYATARQYTRANQEYHTRAGDDALLSAGDVDFTIAAWVYLDSKPAAGAPMIAGKFGAVGDRGYLIYYRQSTDRFEFQVSSNGVVSTTLLASSFGSPSTATWYLFVAWHDSVVNTLNVQIDNGTVDSASYSAGVFDNASPFEIGAYRNFYETFDGRIGPTAFWKSAAGGGGVLSSAQRDALWNAGNGLPYASFTA